MAPVTVARWLTAGAGVAAVALGVAVLLGWLIGSPRLTAVYASGRAMVPITALTFVVAGAALLLLREPVGAGRRRALGRAGALATAAVGAATIVAYVAGADPWRPGGVEWAALPAPTTALALFTLGAAMALLEIETHHVRPSETLATAATLLALFALAGHAYRVEALYGYSTFTGVAVNTAAGLAVLAVGVFFARPARGLASLVLAATAAGAIVRWLLPATVAVPFVLGWLRLRGQGAGLFDTEFGVAMMVVVTIALLAGLVLVSARAMHGLEAARHRAENELRRSEERYRLFFQRNPAGAFRTHRDGRILEINDAFVRMFGYDSADEVRAHNIAAFYADPADRAPLLAEFGPDRPSVTRTLRARRRDGREMHVLLTVTTVETAGPVFEGQVVDVTAEREAEQLRAMVRLAHAVAHEINNPLAVVIGNLEILAQAPGVTPAMAARIAKIRGACDRIRDMVARMARITRVEMAARSSPVLPEMLDIRKSSEAPPEGGSEPRP